MSLAMSMCTAHCASFAAQIMICNLVQGNTGKTFRNRAVHKKAIAQRVISLDRELAKNTPQLKTSITDDLASNTFLCCISGKNSSLEKQMVDQSTRD